MSKYDFTGLVEWGKMTGWFDLAEAIAIQMAVKQLPNGAQVVELGCFQGKSSVAIASVLPPEGRLFCVDMFRGMILQPGQVKPPIEEVIRINVTAFENNIEKFGVKEKVDFVVMSTTEAANKFEANSIDLLFIDADHSYEGVMADLQNWYPKLKAGGWLFCDDYGVENFPGVARAIKSFGLQGEVVAPSLWRHKKPVEMPAVINLDSQDRLQIL